MAPFGTSMSTVLSWKCVSYPREITSEVYYRIVGEKKDNGIAETITRRLRNTYKTLADRWQIPDLPPICNTDLQQHNNLNIK